RGGPKSVVLLQIYKEHLGFGPEPLCLCALVVTASEERRDAIWRRVALRRAILLVGHSSVIAATRTTLLTEPDWRERQRTHAARVDGWISPHRERAARGQKHPVE